MTILSTVDGVPDRAYDNASKAFMRDPRRSLRLLDFMTRREREILMFTSLSDMRYEAWLRGDHNV